MHTQHQKPSFENVSCLDYHMEQPSQELKLENILDDHEIEYHAKSILLSYKTQHEDPTYPIEHDSH